MSRKKVSQRTQLESRNSLNSYCKAGILVVFCNFVKPQWPIEEPVPKEIQVSDL